MSTDNTELAKAAKGRGNKHFQSKNWDEAISEYSQAIELLPEGDISHTFYSNRSACYAGKQDFERALADGLKCNKLKPDWAKGYSRVGLAYFKLGKYDEAEQAYEDGLKIDANNVSLKNGLEETKRAKENGGPTGGGGGGAGAGGLFGPEIWMQIHSHPELKAYASDPDFVQKVKMLQSNPQMAMQMGLLGDEKIKKLFEVMLGARFGGGDEDGPKDESKNDDTDMTGGSGSGSFGGSGSSNVDADSNNNDSVTTDKAKENDTKDDDSKSPNEDEFAGMTEEEKADILEERKRKADALAHKNEGNKLYKEKIG